MKANFNTYATISIDDLPKVDFNQVGQTSNETVRRSLDLTKFILSWNETPTFIEDETIVPIGQYNHSEILEIVQTDEWQDNE
ncbi:MAG: hypothetical protein Unbinned2819contig1004_26 [Prokaryotic dsDNA virus sp.]|nr:MAG: hypothetical protein Unbinned2819contig1004_26 [Prokaryotic dsDNA virus sp.]|tara:strand:- start:2586 stop:2831 length:246 start_codon:yes stop_codon:yes gene_type:complete